MDIRTASNQAEWDNFLVSSRFSPFLQSWTMGEVYRELGQEPIRLELRDGTELTGICSALIVPARRGRHLSIPYGPVLKNQADLEPLLNVLKETAKKHACSFIRLSPHWPIADAVPIPGSKRSPLHLLAEHLWYLPLQETDPWTQFASPNPQSPSPKSADDLFKAMRSTARNLIRRAEKDGVTIEASTDPLKNLPHFLKLHDETRQRHGFTPYTNRFFEAQMRHFAPRGECTLYLAHYQNEVISASIHMHLGGETSYHHGASTHRFRKIPSSYLLQWRAIEDALKRKDSIYNFWGIAPLNTEGTILNPKHPFAGVTLFKTGFGGKLLELQPCTDVPLNARYQVTRGFETLRKWRRGF